MRDGSDVILRPIRPEDEPLMIKFHETISDRRLVRIYFTDYDCDMALIGERVNPDGGQKEITAVARLSRIYGTSDAEFTMLISDKHQSSGLGTQMFTRLIEIAKKEGMSRVIGSVLAENAAMRRTCEKLGFTSHVSPDPATMRVELKLSD
jgi:acetyltransferase